MPIAAMSVFRFCVFRSMRSVLSALLIMALAASGVHGQTSDWKPEKNVEIMVPITAGSAVDRTARLIQKILQDRKLIDASSSVVNKPGGGGAIGWTYLNQHAGDGHYVAVATIALLTNHIIGQSTFSYTDFTPLAMLMSEHVTFAVKPDSSLRTGRDLVERLRKDPSSVSITFAPAIGNQFHIAAAQVMKSAGGDPRKLKVVVFNGSAEAMSAVLGGHVDVIVTAASNVVPQMKAERLRMIAVASPQRAAGLVAEIPTWKEHGIDAAIGLWRGVVGPRGLAPAQIAYWDQVLARATRAEEWQMNLEASLASDIFAAGGDARNFLDAQYRELKNALSDLGLAKQ